MRLFDRCSPGVQHPFRPVRELLAMAVLPLAFVWLGGCDCSGSIGGEACTTDGECSAEETCVDGRCRPRTDAGRRDGGRTDCTDRDRDGRCAADDCDDEDPNRGGADVCDGVDNDCDTNVDEGVHPLCRDCAPGCEAEQVPGTPGWMPTEENAEGVIVDEGGALTLGRNEARAFAVWVANMNEGTVSKLDSRTGREVARYPTIGAGAPAGVRPWNEPCNWSNLGNCPSRTSVDQNFDAYVANRAFGNMGTVTKYANRETECVDRNGNGAIDTSRDLNDDGVITIGSAEFVGLEDECILWTTAVGRVTASGIESNSWPRALTIGLAPPDGLVGDVWVGLFNHRLACRLDPATGATLACMEVNNFQPYGMATDSFGRLWVVDRSGARRDVLGFVDPFAMTFTTVEPMPGGQCAVPYGITVDGAGDVFMANQCNPGLWRYRHASSEWTPITVAGGGTARGVAADESSLWVALSHTLDGFAGSEGFRVLRYNLADLSFVSDHAIPTGRGPIGVGVSFDGSIWAICQNNSIAARLDPITGTWTEHPVGLNPYTYSDFIGFGLNVFAEPRGHYRFVVEGCDGGTNVWRGASYRSETPGGTAVTLFARTADTRAGLAAEPWVGPFEGSPTNFENPPGPLARRRFLEVEVRLTTMDRTVAPRVFSVDVAHVCEPIVE
jgi:streptogramin lyase